jgi:hypothetical protein
VADAGARAGVTASNTVASSRARSRTAARGRELDNYVIVIFTVRLLAVLPSGSM